MATQRKSGGDMEPGRIARETIPAKIKNTTLKIHRIIKVPTSGERAVNPARL
jgi:hypothetical protein